MASRADSKLHWRRVPPVMCVHIPHGGRKESVMKRKMLDASGVPMPIPKEGIGDGRGENQIVVYQPNETIRLDVRLENETVWLTQAQLCELFQRDVSVISRHIKNIFVEGELEKESNLHFLQIANSDRPVALYSLDVIISVGYRVKSVIISFG